jgi:flagellar L-ring protein FlgH
MRILLAFCLTCGIILGGKEKKKPEPSALDRYIAESQNVQAVPGSPGSLWSPDSSWNDAAIDFRARRTGDLVTILVVERASAVASGTTKTARSSSASASVGALLGTRDPSGRLANLANLGGSSQLDGQGQTTREMVLRTTLTGRVIHVMPNGNLIVEAAKQVAVNSESQMVRVRGIIRPVDVTSANTVYSDQLGEMELSVNGKGVVGDAIRRPNLIYRLLLGVLPF